MRKFKQLREEGPGRCGQSTACQAFYTSGVLYKQWEYSSFSTVTQFSSNRNAQGRHDLGGPLLNRKLEHSWTRRHCSPQQHPIPSYCKPPTTVAEHRVGSASCWRIHMRYRDGVWPLLATAGVRPLCVEGAAAGTSGGIFRPWPSGEERRRCHPWPAKNNTLGRLNSNCIGIHCCWNTLLLEHIASQGRI